MRGRLRAGRARRAPRGHRARGRGGEVRVLTGGRDARTVWQQLDPAWFQWEEIINIPWASRLNINVAEARSRQLAIRWRARRLEEHSTRHVGILDSQVNLSHASKGRGGSWRMRHVELPTAGHLLAIKVLVSG